MKCFIYQPKAKLDVNILFGEITHLLDLEIRKMPLKDMYVKENSTFHSVIDVCFSICFE